MPPTEPRADDPGALVEIARENHYPDPAAVGKRYCYACSAYAGESVYYPCLTARLADALEQAHSRTESLHDRLGASLWDCDAARAEADALRERVERSHQALKPAIDYICAVSALTKGDLPRQLDAAMAALFAAGDIQRAALVPPEPRHD